MAAPNMNGRLHLTGVHQKPPASLMVTVGEGSNQLQKKFYNFRELFFT